MAMARLVTLAVPSLLLVAEGRSDSFSPSFPLYLPENFANCPLDHPGFPERKQKGNQSKVRSLKSKEGAEPVLPPTALPWPSPDQPTATI